MYHEKLLEEEHEHVKLPWWKSCGDIWPKPKLMRPGDLNSFSYEREREMTWSELFFDLIFVTATARLGEQLRESGDFLSYALYFFTIWVMWMTACGYSTRFGSDDLPNKLFFAGFMAGLIGMTMHLQDGFAGENCQYFAYCAAFCDLLMILMYARIVYHMDKTARGFAVSNIFYVGGRFICFVTISLWAPEHRIWAFVGVLVFSNLHMVSVILRPCIWNASHRENGSWYDRKLCCNHGLSIPNAFLPLHLEHFTERVGLLTIIYLGETVDDLTQPCSVHTAEYYLLVVLGFLTILSLKLLYFDVAVGDVDRHALRRHRLSGTTWYFSHIPLSAGICIMGSGINLVCTASQHPGEASTGEELGNSAGRILCSVGFVMTIASNSVISFAHKREWHRPLEERVFYWRSLRNAFWVQIAGTVLVISTSLFLVFFCNNESWLTDMILMGIHAGSGLWLTCLNFLDKVVEMRHCGAEDNELENVVEDSDSAEETTSLLAADGELSSVMEGGEGLETLLRGATDGYRGLTLDAETYTSMVNALAKALVQPPPPPPPSKGEGYLQATIPVGVHPPAVDPPRRVSRARNTHLHGLHFVAPHAGHTGTHHPPEHTHHPRRRHSEVTGRRRYSQPALAPSSSVNFM